MKKILVVDDNQQNLYMLQVLLSSKGFEVQMAANGAEALEQARRTPPDMIISDILMPVMDGFALCRAWREDAQLKNVPFVFYTATYTDPKDEAFSLSLGADRFIVKPIEPEKLLSLLLEVIESHKAGKPVSPREPLKEKEYYKEYNAALVRKLEDKILQLEETNRALELDIMKRKRAELQNKEQFERLNALRKIDNAINASFELGIVLKVLLEQVTAHLRVDAAAVLLISTSMLTLKYAASSGFHTRAIEQTEVRVGSSAAGRVAIERKTLQLTKLSTSQADKNFVSLWEQEEFEIYIGVPLIAKGQVKGVLEIYHRSPLELEPEQVGFLEALAGQAAIAIDNSQLFDKMQNSNFDLTLAYDATIEGWSRAMDLRDEETEGHTQRVTELTLRLAARMGVSEQEQVHIRRGALLHDMGKLGVPDYILLKPGPLTDEEWVIMRRHPVHAYNMLMPIAYLRPALDIPYCHHEKWDGTGYPRGLKGEQIPIAARLFAVVDVWDALRSDRPYRAKWSPKKTLQHIREQAGKHFDPEVVDVFLSIIGEGEIPADKA